MVKDISSYQCLNLYSQGFVFSQGEEELGDLQTIRLVIRNNLICSAKDSETILDAYFSLCNAIRNKEINSPIVFTNEGGRPRIGIVPNLSNKQD
jgi:hypothetical protein